MIEQVNEMEKLVMKCLNFAKNNKLFKDVTFTSGWGECKRDENGYQTERITGDYVRVAVSDSSPSDEDDDATREIIILVTLNTCEGEGCETHKCRELDVSKKLCRLEPISDTQSQFRWSFRRLYNENGDRMTEFEATVTVIDPCYHC